MNRTNPTEQTRMMLPQIRLMTSGDIPAGMRLKDMAGWNQTREDWERFLHANPEGCFVALSNGQVVGTVATIIYENRFAWIGMVLVDPRFRDKGIGTALLAEAIHYLDAKKIPCVKLDATPQGEPIYQRLGFQVEYEICRCMLERKPARSPVPARAEEPASLLEMDREVFGADRSLLLASVAKAAPEFVILARQSQGLKGYALGRKGSRADHLGPWIACSELAAREILEEFLFRSRRELVFVDILKDNPSASALVSENGFGFSRTLARMYRGQNAHSGRPDLVYAILGPEFG